MGGASHGSSRPVRTCPFDLITFHVFFISFWLYNLLYLTCVMVNKAVKKKKKKKKKVSNSYVTGLVFLRLGVTNSYVLGVTFITLGG